MAILLMGNIPLLYFLNRSWFNTLKFHPVGKLILAVTGVVIFVSLAGVIKLSRPVEYRRLGKFINHVKKNNKVSTLVIVYDNIIM